MGSKVAKKMVASRNARNSSVKKVEPSDKNKKNTEIEKSLVNKIDEFLEESGNSSGFKKSPSFAPSNNNNCPRYLGYRLRGFEQETKFSGQTLRIFDNGNDVEARLIQYLKSMHILKDSQVELYLNDPPIRAFLDILIELDGIEMPIEVKSISDPGFNARKKVHKPKEEHYRQLQVYLDIGDWKKGILLYVNRSNNELLPILVDRNQEYIERLYLRWRGVKEAHDRGELSVRPFKKTSSKCKTCPAFDYCWNVDQTEGVEIKIADMPKP